MAELLPGGLRADVELYPRLFLGACFATRLREDMPDCDIGVLGGGPSGATAATLLARLGYDVCLLEQHDFPRPHVGESLPPSIMPLLELLGVLPEIEIAGFLRYYGADVRWAGERRWHSFPRNKAGFQVDRGRFDKLLLDNARAAGVRVIQPARARRAAKKSDFDWRIDYVQQNDDLKLFCRYLIDATGRYRLTRPRIQQLNPCTFAIYGYWKHARVLSASTRVEAMDDAWLWVAPLPDQTVNVAVFIDKGYLRTGSSPERVYRELLSNSHHKEVLEHGRLASEVFVCHAGSYACESPATIDSCRVGEAAFAIDPISSQGIQSSVSSGIRGAAVANTCLRSPARRTDALEFHATSQLQRVEEHAAWSAELYQQQAKVAPGRIWRRRQAPQQTTLSHRIMAIRDFIVERL